MTESQIPSAVGLNAPNMTELSYFDVVNVHLCCREMCAGLRKVAVSA